MIAAAQGCLFGALITALYDTLIARTSLATPAMRG